MNNKSFSQLKNLELPFLGRFKESASERKPKLRTKGQIKKKKEDKILSSA